MKLVFASNNKHKLEEIRHAVGSVIDIVSLEDISCYDEIPETHPTIEGNALQKARYIYEKFGVDCFADDTGLEIEALGGAPGVYSARFAGPGCTFHDNMDKTLALLKDKTNRSAAFRTVIALIIDGKEFQFEGRVDGSILTEKHGEKGFGYDAIFLPNGYDQSFAEMDLALKNTLSHRSRATQKMVQFLHENPQLIAK